MAGRTARRDDHVIGHGRFARQVDGDNVLDFVIVQAFGDEFEHGLHLLAGSGELCSFGFVTCGNGGSFGIGFGNRCFFCRCLGGRFGFGARSGFLRRGFGLCGRFCSFFGFGLFGGCLFRRSRFRRGLGGGGFGGGFFRHGLFGRRFGHCLLSRFLCGFCRRFCRWLFSCGCFLGGGLSGGDLGCGFCGFGFFRLGGGFGCSAQESIPLMDCEGQWICDKCVGAE